jgi:hypothetical protein
MIENNKKIRLNQTENITATNIDSYINLNLEQKSKEIIDSEIINKAEKKLDSELEENKEEIEENNLEENDEIEENNLDKKD